LAWYGKKLNPTQQKHTFTNQKKCTTTQKTKPGLVATYDIWSGNGEGLIIFWCFVNLLLTNLHSYPLTAPGPTRGRQPVRRSVICWPQMPTVSDHYVENMTTVSYNGPFLPRELC